MSCKTSGKEPDYDDFQHIIRRGDFDIYIPKYLFSDKKMNRKADVSYVDSTNNTFFMVIKEVIPDTELEKINIELDNYYNFALKAIENSLSDAKELSRNSMQINNEEAISGEISGEYGGKKVYYSVTIIKTEQHFYQLIGWTLYELKDTNGKDLYHSALSFQLRNR